MKICTRCKTKEAVPGGSWCRECKNEYQRDRRANLTAEQREKVNAQMREYTKAYYVEQAVKRRLTQMKYRYGVSEETIMAILSEQDNKCAICKDDLGEKFDVDHDHKCCKGKRSCGKCVRGILCPGCNKGIGLLREDENVMRNAIKYIDKHR